MNTSSFQDSAPLCVALSLGSNLGNRENNLRYAIHWLQSSQFLFDVKQSSFYNSEPVDCPIHAETYLNVAVIGKTYLDPFSSLGICQNIERCLGRPRNHDYHEDRIIDIDILLYGSLHIRKKYLTIPHPEMVRRKFVLYPLHEIAANWMIPPGKLTVQDYCMGIQSKEYDCQKLS